MAGWGVSELPHEPTDHPVSFASGLYTQHACLHCGKPFSSEGECPVRLRAALTDALSTASSARLAGIAEERERVVGWLLADWTPETKRCAEAIERGEHVSRPGVGGREG